MVNGKFTIRSETGLHLRPASDICTLALNYPCKIELKIDDRTINAKSLLGVLSACIKYEDEIELICTGEKEREAFDEISEFLVKDFAVYHIK